MELRNLYTFKTIIDCGSFTAAAEKLNYTQSTITFQINQLESELNIKLFEKVGRKMVLTSAGKQLIPYVEGVLESVDKLHFFEQDISECMGELRIGVAETILNYKLPNAVKSFVLKAPKSKLFVTTMNCYDIRDSLINGDLDIGVFYRDIGVYGDSLILHPIGTYPVSLVASPDIAENFDSLIAQNQRLSIPFVTCESRAVYRQIIEQYLKEQSISFDHTIELGSIHSIKKLVENNVGISFLPKFTVNEELEKCSLVEIPTNVSHNTLTAVCGYHKNKWISPLMQTFIDCVKNETI